VIETFDSEVQEALRRAEEVDERFEAKFVVGKSVHLLPESYFNPGAESQRTCDG
jgi:hypothetical protein